MTTATALPPTSSPRPSQVPGSEHPGDGRQSGGARRRIAQGLRTFQTPVRGHAFAAAPGGGSPPEAGARARLAREPSNPADPLAVAVWVESSRDLPWRIGYLDRGVAARVAPRLDAGLRVDARVEGWIAEPQGRWHRPLVRLVPDAAASREEVASDGDGRTQGSGTPVADRAPLWGRPPGVARRSLRAG